jgi:hypothetical protein
MNPWQIEPTDQFTIDKAWYLKKNPRELEAVLNNLIRYVSQLKQSKNAFCVQAGYLHPEPRGVVALDQKGGGPALQETRLYVYPDEGKRILYLITIGNKKSQSDDIKLTSRFVGSLKISH